MPALPAKPKATGDERHLVTVDENYPAPGLEDTLRLFWEKNSRPILIVAAVLALVLLGNEGRKYLAAQHDREVANAYGAANTPAALKTFAATYADEPQAGLAQLRLGDAAYQESNYAEARSRYEQAALRLEKLPAAAPFAARARLGAAVASLLAGQTTEAESALKKIANDATLLRSIRAEAAFDLAAQAAAAGRTDEVRSLGEQIMKTDPTGPWNERVRSLLTRPAAGATPLGLPMTPGKPEAAPTVTFPVPGK
ncbi:MAG: hypothetical protein WCL04_00215 [Verrucomicrobiota bacterium]